MYEASSKKQLNKVYVFDEFRLSGDFIAEHPRLENHGKVIETLEVSLETPTTDTQLIEILKDCNRFPINSIVKRGDYDEAIAYITSILSEEALRNNDNLIHIHKLDTSK